MTLKSLKDDFAQGHSRFAQGSGNGADPIDRLSGPSSVLANRKAPDDDLFQLPPDGFIHLVPVGEFAVKLKNRSGSTITQVIDSKALDAIVAGFDKELLLNYDHFAHYTDKESRAAGWIQGLEKRPDGIYGKVRWTNSGKRDVTGGEYRYVSPEFDSGDTEALGDGRYRILRLDGAALTNSPNMKTLTPLSNRRDNDQNHHTKMNEKLLNRLRRFFGLSEDADENAILTAVPEDKTHAQLKEANTTLTNRNEELLGQLADKDLEGIELDDNQKKVVRKNLIANREETLALLQVAKGKPADTPPSKLFNREDAKVPNTEEKLKKEEVLAGKISNRADQIFSDGKAGGMTYRQAWQQAEEEFKQD